MLVHLLYFPGCPHVDAARRLLRQALSGLDDPPQVSEIDVTHASTPLHLRVWGSPTILIDGADVAGGVPSATSCRLYVGGESPGVPPLSVLEAALRKRS